MPIRLLRNVLIATTGVALVVSIGVGIWTFLISATPTEDLGPIASNGPIRPTIASNSTKVQESFNGLWDVTLQPRRASNYEQTPPPVNNDATAQFGIMLVGTVVESQQALGLFRDGNKAFDLKGAGQQLELVPHGVRVVSVEPDRAIVFHGGREQTLAMASSEMQMANGMRIGNSPSINSSPVNGPMAAPISDGQSVEPTDGSDPIPMGEDIYQMFPHMDPTRSVPPPTPGLMGSQ